MTIHIIQINTSNSTLQLNVHTSPFMLFQYCQTVGTTMTPVLYLKLYGIYASSYIICISYIGNTVHVLHLMLRADDRSHG